MGRPRADIDKYITKITPYLKLGLTVHEACVQAKIPASTVYDYMRADESIREEIEALENYVAVKAERVVAERILKREDPDMAKWYLERRKRDKYSTKQEVDATGSVTHEHTVKDGDALGALLAGAGFVPAAGSSGNRARPRKAPSVD